MQKAEKTSSTAGTGDIACPYFISHSRTVIVCQSDLPDARTTLSFQDAEAKKTQQRIFCEQHYRKCPHYINVYRWGWES